MLSINEEWICERVKLKHSRLGSITDLKLNLVSMNVYDELRRYGGKAQLG